MNGFLKNYERQQLEAAYSVVPDKRTASNINILLLLDDGYSCDETASILRINPSTVRRHQGEFKRVGLEEYLKNPFTGGVCKLSEEQLSALENYLDEKLYETTDEIISLVESKFNVNYSRSGMSALLHRLGFVFKKPKKIPGKSDPEIQEAFIEYYKKIRETMGSSDKLYFLDGVHPQHNSEAGYGWIRKGKEKELKSNTGRNRVNLNGALDIDSHEVIIRQDETINSASTIELFKMIEKRNPKANKIVLIVDNAPYYYNGDVIDYINKSSKLEVVYLPPYSPNLNLIERVWGFFKKKVIYNKYHETIDDFKTAIGDFFKNLPKYGDELGKILNEEFQVFNP